jgi:hypothetical protein
VVKNLHRAGSEMLLLLVLNRRLKDRRPPFNNRPRSLAPQPIRVHVRLELLSLLEKKQQKERTLGQKLVSKSTQGA